MEELGLRRAVKTQYDASTTAEKYTEGSIENAAKDIGRKYLKEKISELPRASVVVDIGCGSGLDLEAYKEMGFAHLHGIDPSRKFVQEARKLLGPKIDIREGSFEKIPYEDAFFDTVVSRFALHYSKDIATSIREVARVLKSGGTFIAI